ncbi:hypothetical protein ACFPOI_00905 [Nonomuraea angiospora]|uniref:Uncharacterized protein n=1 Tax=Nonomuraea angiospora TaxID=46172 RepID=A0ABR9M374_9ACTN|nr:hypothetical protein [Nonomuraea angiospora]MBE1586963.1 hypothetical protein [Nonomuraea angiospora]
MPRNLRLLVVAAVTASTLTTLSTGTAQAATSNQASAPVHRASISCSRPKGAKANYSWGDGRTSVTVYFNNHCSHKVGAKLHIKNSIGPNYTLCLTTNGGTKGKKKYSIGAARTLTAITSGC